MSASAASSQSLALGERAFRLVKGQSLAAAPRNYEVWYAYAAGHDDRLTAALDRVLQTQTPVSQEIIDKLFDEFIAPSQPNDRLEGIGDHLSYQIGAVTATLDAAAALAERFGGDLSSAALQLSAAPSLPTLRALIEGLARASLVAERENRAMRRNIELSLDELKTIKDNISAVKAEALKDPLTGLFNRRHFNKMIGMLVKAARKSEAPLTLLTIDIDHFKRFNDTYGHLTGDQVLKLVGIGLQQSVNGEAIACRLGGEEFVLILPDTPLAAGVALAENIRRLVMTKELLRKSTNENLGRVTVSVGVAALGRGDTVASLFERADRCLYAAKKAGRNRVVAESDPEVRSETAA